jgi:RNA polymerase sigma-70 factor (ECF subfamily)
MRPYFQECLKLFREAARLTDRKVRKEETRMGMRNIQKKVEEQVLDSYEAMYRLAYTYVRNEEDALDIVQESVYKAIKNAAAVKQEAYIGTWLYRIVMNTAVDYIRKNRREEVTDSIQENGREDRYQDFDTLEALKILDEREKTVIVLRFFEERKLSEIAKILDENINTVKTVLYRSLKKLRIELEEGELSYEQ